VQEGAAVDASVRCEKAEAVRGPYSSLTSCMTVEQRYAWFREQGRAAITLRITKGNYGDPETAYVNSKFRCSGYTVRKKSVESPQWYRQATFGGNEWSVY
jgi:hypothetical protein